jgi:protein-disulfide isomerase
MDRRGFLTSVGVGAATLLAGCAGGDAGGSGGDASATGSTTTGGGQAVTDHPAAAGLADQPRKGDLGGHVVIAFEDPSCTRCRAFERNTVPKIEENLVSTGKGAFVVRNYPVVYPWGESAVQALEATFARSEDAFWGLHGHYFDTQSEFSTDNVLDRTETYLADNTDVDATAVVADAEEKAYDDAVQADITAAENADIGQTTPTVLLFKDGTYVTMASGSVSYEVVATALGE